MWRCALIACGIVASAAAQPEFEVATVRVNRSGSNAMGGRQLNVRTGHASFQNYTLLSLIAFAYQVNEHQVLSAPRWMSTERYDVTAKAAGPVEFADGLVMMQTLLHERFGLKVHREKIKVPGYVLSVAKGGPKLMRSKPENGHGFRIMSRGEIAGPGTISMLARLLKAMLQAPVHDETKLEGVYEIKLVWTPDIAQEGGVPIFTAIQEQLGLQLKAEKVLDDAVVFESANRVPTEN